MRHIKEIMIVAVCLMVLSFCICTGFGIYFMYREGVQEYEDLRTYVKETDEDDHTEGTDGSDGKQTVVDFKALKKINPDIVAWIRIPDTSIDYPVVQGNDDSYYLTHTFKKTEHVAGAIFLDSDNNADFSDDKNIIYGHNMKDGTFYNGDHLCKPEKEDYPGSIRTILGTGEQSPFYMGKQEEIGWNGRFMKNGLILPCTGR